MIPILLCSILTVAICVERSLVLRTQKITPRHVLAEVSDFVSHRQYDEDRLSALAAGSLLGYIMVAGLTNAERGYGLMKEGIEEAAVRVTHEMERYLTTLGTIAAITPLLGLLGTVLGMIKVFAAVKLAGTGNAQVFAGGIAEALITTAAGLTVAIPALIFYRYFTRKVDELVLVMENESGKLLALLHADKAD